MDIVDRTETVYANTGKVSGTMYKIRVDGSLQNAVAPELRPLKDGESLIIEYRKWAAAPESEYDFSASIMREDGSGGWAFPDGLNTRSNRIQVDTLAQSRAAEKLKASIRTLTKEYEGERALAAGNGMGQGKNAPEAFRQIAEVIGKDSAMTIRNPVLGDVVFANGTFGNLEKKNTGGFGIKHIIEGRYRKDHLSKEDISALLYLMKDTVENVPPTDINRAKINLVKNGIWVGITRNWAETGEKWIVTGYGEIGNDGKMTREAADAIKAVSAQYGYTPEFLSVGKQVGAVIASIDRITQNKDLSSHDPLTEYTEVEVDGKMRTCKNGVMEGFKNAVRRVDSLSAENRRLRELLQQQEKQQEKDGRDAAVAGGSGEQNKALLRRAECLKELLSLPPEKLEKLILHTEVRRGKENGGFEL